MKLLIISDAPILLNENQSVAYTPYVNEMNLWMGMVDKTTFVSPSSYNNVLLTSPFKIQDFDHVEVNQIKFTSFKSAFLSILQSFRQFFVLYNLIKEADHTHIRSPGNLALLAGFVQILLPRKRKSVKYAGNWDPKSSQPLAYSMQKTIFSSERLSKNISIMAYGVWEHQSKNVKPFFTATYYAKDKVVFTPKMLKAPFYCIFVGTMGRNKDPEAVLEIVLQLRKNGLDVRLDYYGDGALKENIADRVKKMNLTEVIKVHGNQPKEVVSMAYKTAHFSFLLSQSEGWPKVVAEAMWHGCIPVSTPVSCVPWMLNIPFNDNKGNQNASDRLDDGSQHDPPRGLLHFSKEQTIFELESLIKSERHYHNMQEAAMNFSQQYTMETFETAIRKLIYA